jgi:predicted DNA-binding transcriptional regulator YafY
VTGGVDDALERVTNLLALLLHARVPKTLDAIAHEIEPRYPSEESARRTAFERDKRTLRERGVPIEQVTLGGHDAGRVAYWVDRRRLELPDLGLTDDESQALRLAVAAVRLGVDWGERALQKVDLDAPGSPSEMAGGASAAVAASPLLPDLADANRRRCRVRFRYKGEAREVEPWGLLSREGWWYVVGLAVERQAMRAFRVDRIEGDVDVGEPGAFTVPDGFNPASAFSADAKLLRTGEDEVLAAEVWIAAARASTLVARLGEDAVRARRPDGAVVVAVPFSNRPAFLSWVLGLQDDAEVLGPPDLRAELVARLERMAVRR